jgi:hypothetical protein
MIKAGLRCEVSESPSSVVSANVGVCWVPVPAGSDRGGGSLVSAHCLSYRDVEELLVERGVEVDHVTVYRWVQRFTPLLSDAARFACHASGTAGL